MVNAHSSIVDLEQLALNHGKPTLTIMLGNFYSSCSVTVREGV